MARILITGVSGFVGRRLARRLLEKGHRVFGLTLGDGEEMTGVEVHYADVRDRDAVRSVIVATRPEAVVHLAALSHVGASWRRLSDYFEVNVLGTENVVSSTGAGVALLLASSAEVYGSVPESEQPLREELTPRPQSPYAMTKAMAERWVLARGGRSVVVRLFNVVGPGQSDEFALPSFAQRLARSRRDDKSTLRVGNLSARRDFLHVDDAIAALELLLVTDVDRGIYNLGSGRAVSIGEALDRLVEVAGLEVVIETDPERFRPVDLELLRADTRRLAALGWSPVRALDEALRDLWAEAVGSNP